MRLRQKKKKFSYKNNVYILIKLDTVDERLLLLSLGFICPEPSFRWVTPPQSQQIHRIFPEKFWKKVLLLFPSEITNTALERVPNKRPVSLIFFFKNPPLPSPTFIRTSRLLRFLLCESNSYAICRKKYLLSKKVISKASLKILEENIHV